jgi:nucleoside-triphosphatase THEP1
LIYQPHFYNVFLTGPPGSGKTWLTNKYIEYCINNNIQIAVTASTGIASTQYDYIGVNATTIHSWSGIDIVDISDNFETILARVLSKKLAVDRWRNTKVLIIDEISLLNSITFNAM